MNLRTVELRLIKGLNNPLIKDARLACFLSLALSFGLAFTPWGYNVLVIGYALAFLQRTPERREAFAGLVLLSALFDVALAMPWIFHLSNSESSGGWTGTRLLQMLCAVELLILKWSALQGTIWRLRDEGHVFKSTLLEWESRKVYGNYFGDESLPVSNLLDSPRTLKASLIENSPSLDDRSLCEKRGDRMV